MQEELFANPRKIFQRIENINTIYGRLSPNYIAELTLWHSVHLDLIRPYSKSMRQHHQSGTIITSNGSLTFMTMIHPATGWFKITKIPTYDFDEVTSGNDEYIDKSSVRFSQLFNSTWLNIYPCPRKVIFDNITEFKQDFTPLLKYFDIKPIITTIKKPQSNTPVGQVHELILSLIFTK